jgi:hypothetical protein
MRSAHTFVEVYLPEHGRWVYTDLTIGLFMVRIGENGPPLDTVGFTQLQQMGADSAMVATVFEDGELTDVAFATLPPLGRLFVNPNAFFVYHRDYADRYAPLKRLERYVLGGPPAYALHDHGARFRSRMLWQAALLGAGLLWLVLVVRALLQARARRQLVAVELVEIETAAAA